MNTTTTTEHPNYELLVNIFKNLFEEDLKENGSCSDYRCSKKFIKEHILSFNPDTKQYTIKLSDSVDDWFDVDEILRAYRRGAVGNWRFDGNIVYLWNELTKDYRRKFKAGDLVMYCAKSYKILEEDECSDGEIFMGYDHFGDTEKSHHLNLTLILTAEEVAELPKKG